jgi:4'-phosphopantetheinyl transferase
VNRVPETYALTAGEVHVWTVSLVSANADLGDMASLLSDPERKRAARFAFEKDQARFVSCRASLRLLLARYTGLMPEKIAFRYEPHGKPAVAAGGGWQFNVSHSRDVAAIAISRFDAVGIDIELIDPLFPRDEVAPETMAPDEMQDLAALPPVAQPGWFFQLWTIKEALLKAAGAGFSLEPRDIRIRLDEELQPTIISAPPEFEHATLHRFSLRPRFASALAVLGRTSAVGFYAL